MLYSELYKLKKITTLPTYFYNKAWQAPVEHHDNAPHEKINKPTIKKLNSYYFYSIFSIGCFALLLWSLTTHFHHHGLPVELNRQEAIKIAQNSIDESTPHWQPLSNVMKNLPTQEEEQKMQHLFAWRTAGKNAYQQLLSENYLKPYAWFIRFVHFNGDVTQRAEEYQITLRQKNTLIEKKHIFAENAFLPSLSLEEARKKTHEVLQNNFNIMPNTATEISASPKKQPERTDWVFIYKVPSTVNLQDGQQRITISLAGDQVNDAYQSLFVPETWKREYTEQKAYEGIIKTLSDFIFIIIMVCAIALLATQFNFHYFSWQAFLIFFSILFIKSLIQTYNIWPTAEIYFSTIEPFDHQLWQTLLLWFIIALGKSALIGILAAAIISIYMKSSQFKENLFSRIIIALSTGTLVASFHSILGYFTHPRTPLLPDFAPAGAYFPALSAGLLNLTFFIETTTIFMALIVACDIFTNGWQQRKIYFIALSSLLGIVFMGHNIEASTLMHCVSGGIILGLLFCTAYVYILRFDKNILPCVIGAYILLNTFQQMFFNAYSGAFLGGVISSILIITMILLWLCILQKNDRQSIQ